MNVFLSHFSGDSEFAEVLAERFRSLDVDVFMLPRSVGPGRDWLEGIKKACRRCDELVALISPEAACRPWIAAEWSAFWFQGKPCKCLLLRARMSDLWEPMTSAVQVSDLSDLSDVEELLKSLTDSEQKEGNLLRVARSIASHPATKWTADHAFARISARLTNQPDDLLEEDVTLVAEAGRVEELVSLTAQPTASNVKRRQLAVYLLLNTLGADHVDDGLKVMSTISNKAEIKNAVLRAVGLRDGGRLSPRDCQRVLDNVWTRLGAPQRRELREKAAELSLTLPDDD